MSHTPGPWKRGNCDSFIIWARGYRSTKWVEGEGDEAVAVAWASAPAWARVSCDSDTRAAWLAESEANARLIAAAPDLLEACRAAIKAHEDLFRQCLSNPITNAWGQQVNTSALNEAARLAGAAIAKATGEQQ